MHRLPQCHHGNPRVECQNIYQVNQYNTPLSPRAFICKTYINCSQIWNIQSDNNETSKGKDSIHHNKDREGRNTIWSNYINKARDTSRSCQIKNTREREREIKHIASGTNPQPRGWTTPSSSWRQPGWWRWPPVMLPPSGKVPKKGCRWDHGGTEACGGVKTHLG
jgi:hypothetical protein